MSFWDERNSTLQKQKIEELERSLEDLSAKLFDKSIENAESRRLLESVISAYLEVMRNKSSEQVTFPECIEEALLFLAEKQLGS